MKFTPDELLKECNRFREAGGAEELKKLLPGKSGDANSCLIARNLNFRCLVGYSEKRKQAWIQSNDSRLNVVAKKLGLISGRPPFSRSLYSYCLPDDLYEAALAFDLGHYDKSLYEWK